MPNSIPRLLAVAAILCLPVTSAATESYARYASDNDFETVMEGATMAIEERGMYINNLMHMDEMLERTGRDLGMEQQLFLKARSIEFCSAVLSRKMAAEDPGRIVYCPFILSVYVVPQEPNKTYIAYRRVPEQDIRASTVMAEVAQMLKDVAEGAVSW